MPETKFIDAYDRETGKKYVVPARWLDLKHPQFQKFRKTPLQKKSEGGQGPTPGPITKNTKTTTESEG